jgi:hypothetical protein
MSRVGDPDFHETCRSLLGKKVRATISDEPLVQHIGILHGFTDDGEVDIREVETGIMQYAWPLLEIEQWVTND